MADFFNPERQPWRALGRAVDFVGLSLCCAFCTLGVVTAGASLSALYYTVVKVFRHKEDGAFGIFFKSFIANLKQGCIVTLICIPVLAAMAFGYIVLRGNAYDTTSTVLYSIYSIFLIVPLGIIINVFPLMGRFKYSTSELFKTSFKMTFAHLPSTVITVLLSVELTVWTINNWAPVFITPALWALLSSLFWERNYEKHMSEEEIEKFRGKE
ncbi:MAG: DUF624 domain-containing protein [Sphaerochaetaceae bacterium]|nr:DUF624 domain-containing protein [Sphaerochaetaceae bacterium]